MRLILPLNFLRNFWQDLSFFRLARASLALFLIIFPLQIRMLIYGGTLYVGGNFNPYTSFFLYASDILLVLAFLMWGVSLMLKENFTSVGVTVADAGAGRGADAGVGKDAVGAGRGAGSAGRAWSFGYEGLTILLAVFVAMIAVGTFTMEDSVLTGLLMIRLLLFFMLYFLILNGVLVREEVIKFFLAGMVFQAGLAVVQYLLQGSVGLHFLGEPVISPVMPGVAKIDIDGEKLLRPYGTFPHANVLAGALLTGLAFCCYGLKKHYRVLLPLALFFLLTLLLTFSRSAFLGLMAGALVYFSVSEQKPSFKYLLLVGSLLTFFAVLLDVDGIFIQRLLFWDDPGAVLERAEYFKISKNMLLDNPLGVGLGNFTVYMQDYTQLKLAPWLLQPVHNVFLLALNEVGVAGGALFALIFVYLYRYLVRALKFLKKSSQEKQFGMLLLALLTGIIVISLFDHYFFTLYQGQVLLFLYFGLASAFLKKSGLPRKNS